MRTINQLSEFIANQIAAGEVVQRPESVVKELVENSLDAYSNHIIVRIAAGGKNLIEISDNGSGMSREDLEISTLRHSTSKISTAEDLESISTYGFRGEALASITSVSTLEIKTRQKDDLHGWHLHSEPQKPLSIEPCNIDIGTTISVKNLFFNTPARRKFLKANITEYRYISETMVKFALSRNDVQFTFYNDKTLIFDVAPLPLEERIPLVLGKSNISSLIPVDYSDSGIRVHGFIGNPFSQNQGTNRQYFFLNKRSIKSRSLVYAVLNAYEHLIEKTNNPFFLINLELNPKTYDVNVHPQKHEVKFEDEKIVFNIIRHAVSDALQKSNIKPRPINDFNRFSYVQSEENKKVLVDKETGEIIERAPIQFNSELKKFQNQDYRTQYQEIPTREYSSDFQYKNHNENVIPIPPPSEVQEQLQNIYNKTEFNKQPVNTREIDVAEQISSNKTFKTEAQIFGRFLNKSNPIQIHNKYILLESARGLILIDQHAAHERILYERAVKAMNREFSYSQGLLYPILANLTPPQAALVVELKEELDDLGFVIDIKDSYKIEIKSLPLDIKPGFEETALAELLTYYEEAEEFKIMKRRDRLAATFACKAAIKTGQILSIEEMLSLIYELERCTIPNVCPHGRPVTIEFGLEELDRMFFRT